MTENELRREELGSGSVWRAALLGLLLWGYGDRAAVADFEAHRIAGEAGLRHVADHPLLRPLIKACRNVEGVAACRSIDVNDPDGGPTAKRALRRRWVVAAGCVTAALGLTCCLLAERLDDRRRPVFATVALVLGWVFFWQGLALLAPS